MTRTENISSLFRTTGVLLAGVALSFALAAVLTMLLAPDAAKLLGYQMGWVPLPATSRIEIARQIRANTFVLRWVVTPLVGVGVGLFVGLLQRSRPGLVAAICLVPITWKVNYYPLRFYPVSAIERAEIVAPHLLSMFCCIVLASVIKRARSRGTPGTIKPSPVET